MAGGVTGVVWMDASMALFGPRLRGFYAEYAKKKKSRRTPVTRRVFPDRHHAKRRRMN
jgi:hypothetical protein